MAGNLNLQKSHNLLLEKIVNSAPQMVEGIYCSLYLKPDLVPEFKNKRSLKGKKGGGKIDKDNIIVLAATSDARDKSEIGKKFYQAKEGLTGAIFSSGRPLHLNRKHKKEIEAATSGWGFPVTWKRKYKKGNLDRPFLGVPLKKESDGQQVIGVLKIPEVNDNNRLSLERMERIATELSRVISFSIEQIYVQESTISDFIRLGTYDEQKQPEQIVKLAAKLVRGSGCSIFVLDQTSENLKPLQFEINSELFKKKLENKTLLKYPKGIGLTGWIFKTGIPLNLTDLEQFGGEDDIKWKKLTNENILTISSGDLKGSDLKNFNEDYRWIRWEDLDGEWKRNKTKPFLGVPILDEEDRVTGVLRVTAKEGDIDGGRFSEDDLSILKSFAKQLSNIFRKNKENRLKDLLLDLHTQKEDNFLISIVEELPKIINSHGCSIFIKNNAENFILKETSSEHLKKHIGTLSYAANLKSGKTGYTLFSGRTLIINHYGHNELEQKELNKDYIQKKESNNYLCDYLKEDNVLCCKPDCMIFLAPVS